MEPTTLFGLALGLLVVNAGLALRCGIRRPRVSNPLPFGVALLTFAGMLLTVHFDSVGSYALVVGVALAAGVFDYVLRFMFEKLGALMASPPEPEPEG